MYNNRTLLRPLQDVPRVCSSNTGVNPSVVTLRANASTVHWGYYYAGAAPQLVVNSGDTVNVEMVSHKVKQSLPHTTGLHKSGTAILYAIL